MLTILESLYCALFVIAAVQGARVALELGQPRWLTTSGTIASALGTAGMLLHLSGEVSPELGFAWRFVLAAIVLHLLVELVYEWRSGLFLRIDEYGRPRGGKKSSGPTGPPPDSARQARSLALTGTAIAILFALPMLWMNAAVALGA